MRMSRRAKIAAGAVALALAGAAVAFGPVVRSRVRAEAAGRGLVVTVGGVRPGWFAVRLLDVHVAPEGVDAVSATLDEVDVGLSAGLSVKEVSVPGGSVAVHGTPQDVGKALAEWRGRHPAGKAQGGSRSSRTMRVDGMSLRWEELDGPGHDAVLEADGVSVERGTRGTSLRAKSVDGHAGPASVHAASCSLDL